MDLEINVLGDGAYVLAVLNAVSGFSQAQYGTLGAIGMLLGMLLMMLKGIMEPGGPKFAPQTMLISIVIFWVMFIPRVDRVIVAEVTVRPGEASPRSFVVDNVPLGLAGAGYLISNLGVQVTKAYETGFGSAEDTERGTTGGLGRNLALMGQLRTMISDPRFYDPPQGYERSVINTFRTNMTEYMGQCTLPQVEARNLAPEKIFSEPGISGVVNDITANPVSAMVWTATNGDIETITCRDAASRISSIYEDGNELEGAFNRAMQASGSEIESDDVVEAFANYANSSGISMQRMMATMMVNSVASEAAVRSSLSPADTQAIIMVEEAAQRRNVQWAGEESLFIRILRPIVGFFEALFYALAPIMAFICTLGPMGWKLMGKYTMLTIWVGLWFPMLSLTQLYSNIEMRYFFDTLGNGADYSPDQLTKIATEAMDTLGTASALTAATPALAMSLLYGGAVSMSYLAGRLQGSDHIDEGKVAPKASEVAAVASAQGAMQQSMYGGVTKPGAADVAYSRSTMAETMEQSSIVAQRQAAETLSHTLSSGSSSFQGFGFGSNHSDNFVTGSSLQHTYKDGIQDMAKRDLITSDQAQILSQAQEHVGMSLRGGTPSFFFVSAGFEAGAGNSVSQSEVESAINALNQGVSRDEGLASQFTTSAGAAAQTAISNDSSFGFRAEQKEEVKAAAQDTVSAGQAYTQSQTLKNASNVSETVNLSQVTTKLSANDIDAFRAEAISYGVPPELISELTNGAFANTAAGDPAARTFGATLAALERANVPAENQAEVADLYNRMASSLFATGGAVSGPNQNDASELMESAPQFGHAGSIASGQIEGPRMGADAVQNAATGIHAGHGSSVHGGHEAILGSGTAQNAGAYGMNTASAVGPQPDKDLMYRDKGLEADQTVRNAFDLVRENNIMTELGQGFMRGSQQEKDAEAVNDFLNLTYGTNGDTYAEWVEYAYPIAREAELARLTGSEAPAEYSRLPDDVRNFSTALAQTDREIATMRHNAGEISLSDYASRENITLNLPVGVAPFGEHIRADVNIAPFIRQMEAKN